MNTEKKMHSLQQIMIPFSRLPERYGDMYFRGYDYQYNQRGEIIICAGGKLATDTYFNGFSIRKWKKYTKISDLFLKIRVKGTCNIFVRCDYRTEYGIAAHALAHTETEPCEQEVLIDLSDFLDHDGMISFDVQVNQDTVIYNAEYVCTAEPTNVNIALAVCTFKREKYVYRLMQDYQEMNHDGIRLFISDNGKTLKNPIVDGIHLFPNKNYGGAGGFTRCMLEVKRYNLRADAPLTHIVLMDDDILLDIRVIHRLKAFLQMRKAEYDNYFVCGAMCSLDEPDLQYERNSVFRGGNNFQQRGAGYRLTSHRDCVINEEDDELTYFRQCTAGWWFCCFAVKMYNENNYPFPCFFRGDDIEYALRNGSRVITLNGLNVWHEPFYKKYSNTAENYYLPRNALVINLLYRTDPIRDSLMYLNERMKSCLIQYDYDGLRLLNRAMEDFFKGPDFFANTDAEKLNKELSAMNHKMIPFKEALEEYDYGDIVFQANDYSDSNRFVKFVRKLTLNGYLIPKCFYKDFRVSGVGFRGRAYSYFRRKRVFNADTFGYCGYFTEIDKKQAWKLYMEYRRNVKYLKKHFQELQNLYTLKFPYLQTEKFWVDYLEIDPIQK